MKRIKDNYITSLIGAGIIGVAFYLIITGNIDREGFAAMVVLGLTYLRAKDTLIGLPEK